MTAIGDASPPAKSVCVGRVAELAVLARRPTRSPTSTSARRARARSSPPARPAARASAARSHELAGTQVADLAVGGRPLAGSSAFHARRRCERRAVRGGGAGDATESSRAAQLAFEQRIRDRPAAAARSRRRCAAPRPPPAAANRARAGSSGSGVLAMPLDAGGRRRPPDHDDRARGVCSWERSSTHHGPLRALRRLHGRARGPAWRRSGRVLSPASATSRLARQRDRSRGSARTSWKVRPGSSRGRARSTCRAAPRRRRRWAVATSDDGRGASAHVAGRIAVRGRNEARPTISSTGLNVS